MLDWDVKAIETALPWYLADVFARLSALSSSIGVVESSDIALYAEPMGLGKVVMIEAWKSGHDVREVREDITALDLQDRATAALVYVHAGQVKIAREAFEKVGNFRGTARNHLRTQIAEYSIEQRADQVELLTAWCTRHPPGTRDGPINHLPTAEYDMGEPGRPIDLTAYPGGVLQLVGALNRVGLTLPELMNRENPAQFARDAADLDPVQFEAAVEWLMQWQATHAMTSN